MAHELAHNLGVYHDDKTFPDTLVSRSCSGDIMDANGIRNTGWSSCTVNYMKMFFEGYPQYCSGEDCIFSRRYGSDPCLEEAPAAVWSLDPICGNGVREEGEDCDCGEEDCSDVDPCCDGDTCKLKDSSFECSALDICCDPDTCLILPLEKNPKVCREAKSSCDIEETCDGQQATCPIDEFVAAGTECSAEIFGSEVTSGTCYAGYCNSHASQCAEYNSFDGPCRSRGDDDLDKGCGNLYCHYKGTPVDECRMVEENDEPVTVLDGTTCGVSNEGDALVCSAMSSTCITVSDLMTQSTYHLSCYNGLLDSGETDVDCGGPLCPSCLGGEACAENSDCVTNDCILPGTQKTEYEEDEHEFIEYPGGCGTLLNFTACTEWSGCIWLNYFSQCKPTALLPPSGYCYTQKKQSSCINYLNCEWLADSSQCRNIIDEQETLGFCFGNPIGAESEQSWVESAWKELLAYFSDNELLLYIFLGAVFLSAALCIYSCCTIFTAYCCYTENYIDESRITRFSPSPAKRMKKRKQKAQPTLGIEVRQGHRRIKTPEAKSTTIFESTTIMGQGNYTYFQQLHVDTSPLSSRRNKAETSIDQVAFQPEKKEEPQVVEQEKQQSEATDTTSSKLVNEPSQKTAENPQTPQKKAENVINTQLVQT
eukprot:augustus_masked-scaffold_4-processed-gene-20.44-mRNA-1 protein AED:0.43 eAED:0.49 QI:0/-1/0/1/-1/1/1/0/650